MDRRTPPDAGAALAAPATSRRISRTSSAAPTPTSSLLAGLLNGALVTKVRLPAFIVTLGTLNIAMALVHIYSNEETIANVPSAMTFFGRIFTIGGTGITYGVVVMLVLYAVVWYVLTQTAWGSHVYAVGNNPQAARLAGIRTDRLLISV